MAQVGPGASSANDIMITAESFAGLKRGLEEAMMDPQNLSQHSHKGVRVADSASAARSKYKCSLCGQVKLGRKEGSEGRKRRGGRDRRLTVTRVLVLVCVCMCGVHVCMCACVHVCVLCVCARMFVGECVRMCVCERASTCACVCAFVRASACACLRVYGGGLGIARRQLYSVYVYARALANFSVCVCTRA